jgi:hypothetical protein
LQSGGSLNKRRPPLEDLLGGYLGSFWSSMGKPQFFLMIAAAMMTALNRPLRSVLES